MSDENTKVSANRAKKIEIVAKLNEKIASAKAIVFTNYQGLTHKQPEGLKRTIKPLKAEYVVAKNSLVLRALEENKIKVEDQKQFEGPTGTLLIYEDVVGPLKELAKLVKEFGIPNVKFGIVEDKRLTGEQVMKLSTLPSRETLLTQLVFSLKSPIFGLHRSLSWNIQKLLLTLNAISQAKPALAVPGAPVSEPAAEPVISQPVIEPTQEQPEAKEQPQAQEEKKQEVKIEGGEN
jgi:large subunit ribosomal protein L10